MFKKQIKKIKNILGGKPAEASPTAHPLIDPSYYSARDPWWSRPRMYVTVEYR